jgi:hypothetical protein
METYAHITSGVVDEIIAPLFDDNGNAYALAARFTPQFVSSCVDITSTSPQPVPGWTYSGAAFAPPAGPSLADVQAAQIAVLNDAYQAAINAPVSFTTAAGATALFNQNATAKANLQDALLASEKAASWPINLWVSASGSPITPFTYADLQGLAAAMEAVDAPDYQQLLTLMAEVTNATTIAAVQAVVWP